MYGVNINCKVQGFITEMLSGLKVIETRNKPTLHKLIGQRIGLVQTGKSKAMLMGYATISGYVEYHSPEEFDRDYAKHRVAPGSPYYIKGMKYGYVLKDIVPCEPIPVTSKGIVYRKV